MSELFPTFACLTKSWPWSQWLSTPWWPADTLASKQHALLQLLEVAVSERLEFAPLVTSLAQEHRGRYRRQLLRLAKRMTAGTSLPDALEQIPGTLSDEQMLAIRFAAESGTLAEVLRALVDQQDQALYSFSHRLRQIGFYGAFVIVTFLLVLSFIMVKIVPSFQAIMEDFSLGITDSLKLLIYLSKALVSTGPLLPLGLLLCVWLIKSELLQRFFRRRVWSRLFKPIAQLRSANLLSLLAIAQQAGRPLPATLSTLARYHYDSLVRHKLLFARNEVEQGADLWEGLTKARLLSTDESRALGHSTVAGSTAWTLGHLASWKRSRVARRLEIYLDFLLPTMILLMAAAVLLVALATLTPLFKMTNDLS